MGHSEQFFHGEFGRLRRIPFVLQSLAMYIEVHLGDRVRLRKKHPCGNDEWDIIRLGADIGLVCCRCRRR